MNTFCRFSILETGCVGNNISITSRLRDRDSIVTGEGIIFRVYGYSHPAEGYICDPEYAPEGIFLSNNSRAFRKKRDQNYYKFFEDEGLKFIIEKHPRYMIFDELLQKQLVGVPLKFIAETRKPDEAFTYLMEKECRDVLLRGLHKVYELIETTSGLSRNDFGVFGSLLHDFYHPEFSDIDLIVYGKKKLGVLRGTLEELYSERDPLRNEFDSDKVVATKRWKFINYDLKEYLWHQRRKMIYALSNQVCEGREVKIEFEPVKDWNEIGVEPTRNIRVIERGWVRAIARVTDDLDSSFIPSVYQVEILELLEGPKVDDIQRIISYMEEFRLQAKRDEQVLVEGNLEQVIEPTKMFHQITLTYGKRYYEQVLKVPKI